MKLTQKILNATASLAACAFIQGAWAAPVSVSQGAFSAAQTVIDFNLVSNTQSITNQYAGQGVTFSGALIGLTNPGDTYLFNGSTLASNWNYQGGGKTGSSWSAFFSSPQTLAGFFVETNPNDSVTVEAFLGLTSLGTINFVNPNGLTANFVGIQDLGGFDRITVTTASNTNGFFAMDDFRFEGVAINQIPEPGTMALIGLGLASALFTRRYTKD